MFGKKKIKYVPVPVPEFQDHDNFLFKVKDLLEKKELQNYLRQRIAIASAQIPVYTRSKNYNMVQMLSGKIEELSFLIQQANSDIDDFLNEGKVEENFNAPKGNFTDKIEEDVFD